MKRNIVFALFGVLVFVLMASSMAIAPTGGKPEPLPSSNFVVEIDGIASSSYVSVEGVHSNMEVIEYRDASDPNRVILLAGNARFGPIVLRRGLTQDMELWDWYRSNLDNPVERKAMSIIYMDHGHNEKVRYNCYECWPSEWYIEPLESNPSGVAIEVIVIQTELIERA